MGEKGTNNRKKKQNQYVRTNVRTYVRTVRLIEGRKKENYDQQKNKKKNKKKKWKMKLPGEKLIIEKQVNRERSVQEIAVNSRGG